MTLHTGAGARLTKTALASTPVPADPMVEITNDVYVDEPLEGSKVPGRRLLWNAGDHVPQSEVDDAFGGATITSITPNSGVAAGGTVVTIRGTGFDMATGVTFGGTAGTAFTVVSDTEIRVTTPARAAGAVAVTVVHDGDDATLAGGFTYV